MSEERNERLLAVEAAVREVLQRYEPNLCENLTSKCRDSRSGKVRVLSFSADRWCDACVLADALERDLSLVDCPTCQGSGLGSLVRKGLYDYAIACDACAGSGRSAQVQAGTP